MGPSDHGSLLAQEAIRAAVASGAEPVREKASSSGSLVRSKLDEDMSAEWHTCSSMGPIRRPSVTKISGGATGRIGSLRSSQVH